MLQPKVGDVVLFSQLGRTVNALVLGVRSGEVSRLGKDGEPLLKLAFIKFPAPNAPHKRPTPLQAELAEQEIQIEHDVVHASHEFSSDFKRDKGVQTEAQIAAHRGHGEWTEADDRNDAAFGVLLNDNAATRNSLKDARAEVERLNKLVADLSANADDDAGRGTASEFSEPTE